MIFEYSVKNFKSIMLEEKISFKASSLKDKTDHLINKKILPIIALYGPNGGGKTAIIHSIKFFVDLIKSGKNLMSFILSSKGLRNYEQKDKDIQWNIKFIDSSNNRIYSYTVSITDFINYEKLCYFNDKSKKENVIFEKKDNEIKQISNEIKKTKIKLSNIYGTLLHFISSVIDDEHINFVWNEINKMVIWDGTEPALISISQLNQYNTSLNFEFIKENKEKLLIIFKEVDINISDIKIEKNADGSYIFNMIKKDSWNKDVKIPFVLESLGTQKFIKFITLFLEYINQERYFFIDELDASLHTKLLGYLIKIFTNEKTNSQLVYTSHDIGTLNNKYFRKDEIYFAGLNERRFTNIVSLNEFNFQIRNSNSFSSLYLKGKLGYDPYIDHAMEWLKNNEKK